MRYKSFISLGLALGVVLFVSSHGFSQAKAKKIKFGTYANYNVLLVSFDALQAAHVSALGYPKSTTPTFDRFAKQGFLFKNTISQAPWTVPATMSFFTSLFPSQHKCINKYSTYTAQEKVLTNLKKLSPEVVTLSEVLKANGYTNGGFTGDAGVSGHFGFAQGFDEYFDGPKFGGMDKSIPAALEWLKKNQGKKFFMFLHGYDCHGQYDPPKGFTKRFVDFDYPGPLKGGKEEQGKLREEGLEKGTLELSEPDVKFWRSLYDEKINDVDARFQSFVDELKKMGLLEKTIIILVSDHGTEFYEHKRFDHGFSLYDELLHIPLVFWLPNTDGGVVIGEQVRGLDIMPTVLDLLGIKPSPQVKNQMKGVSLLPAMKGEHLELDAYSETDYRYFTHKRSVRTSDGWKFIYTMENGQKELYNLNEDPQETRNLVDTDKRRAYELEQKLFAWLKTMGQDETYYDRLMKDVLRIKEY